jgi:hypothetical protein
MMKKLTLSIVFLLSGLLAFAQDCGSYIELVGTGMHEKQTMTLDVTNPGEVVQIIAEAIYKGPNAPTKVKFWSDQETSEVDPVTVPNSGIDPENMFKAVFRDTFTLTTNQVHLDILDNDPRVYSMALYIERPNKTMVSAMGGALYHVFQNEAAPLVTEIPVIPADQPRDIQIRFGVTELDVDERYAIFTFEAKGMVKKIEIWDWDPNIGESDSYTIQQVLFENVPGDVDKITMTMLSENYVDGTRKGDSFIAGVVLVDVPCKDREPEPYCTFTQGFYGNEGGKFCGRMSTRDLLAILLTDELVMGGGENTLTIAAGDVDCVLALLPGGGPSAALSGQATCGNLVGIETNRQGRLKNSLLAQGITFSLNMRLSPGLMDFPVDGDPFTTLESTDCGNPEAEGVPGTEMHYAFSPELVAYLGAGATLADLLDLINHALAGEDVSPLSLSQIAEAADMINNAFDECRVVEGMASIQPVSQVSEGEKDDGEKDDGEKDDGEKDNGEKGDEDDCDCECQCECECEEGDEGDEGEKGEDGTGDAKGAVGIGDWNYTSLRVYPNPATDHFRVQLEQEHGQVIAAILYDMNGKAVRNILDGQNGNPGSLQAEVSDLLPGIYVLKVTAEGGSFTARIHIR